MQTLKYIAMLVVITSFYGCANLSVHDPVPLNQIPNVKDTEQRYYIQVGDVVQLRFEERMERDAEEDPIELPVRPDGKISVPFLKDEVEIAGLTPSQATQKVVSEMRKIVHDPIITLNIVSFAPRQVYVGGEVGLPAAIPYRGKTMSALDAILTAGSYTDRSRLNHVILMRYQGIDKKALVMALDLSDAIENHDVAQNVALMPEDIIVVPLSRVANLNRFVDQYINRNVPLPGIVYGFGTAYAIDQLIDDDGAVGVAVGVSGGTAGQ